MMATNPELDRTVLDGIDHALLEFRTLPDEPNLADYQLLVDMLSAMLAFRHDPTAGLRATVATIEECLSHLGPEDDTPELAEMREQLRPFQRFLRGER